MLDINILRDLGGFVSNEPVKKEIKFKIKGKENEATIGVLRLALDDHERIFLNEIDDKSRTARILSEVIRLGENLDQPLSFEDAKRLHPSLAGAFFRAFNEVNEEDEGKN